MTQAQRREPVAKVYRPITTVKGLARHLQWALSVELATIPPYLCALYSIVDRSCDAAALVRSVALEEMLHMAQVANLMNAIGARPSLAEKWVPRYPGHIPHHAAGGPFIQLQPLSAELARAVFMAIERPEPSPHTPAEGNRFETIGQFYRAIEEGFELCAARHPSLFARDTGAQRADTYFGGGGGELVVVHDLRSARRALREITEQGEGATRPRPPTPHEERYGDYDHFGVRADGTYGPILGTPWELSHYGKFEQLASGAVPVPAVYPMQANPCAGELRGAPRGLAELFDGCYTLLVRALARTLTRPAADREFFGLAVPLMRSVLPRVATLLMSIPLRPGADSDVGPTAGPAFAYRRLPSVELLGEARRLRGRAPDLGVEFVRAWDTTLAVCVEVLEHAHAAGGGTVRARRVSTGGTPPSGPRQPEDVR